MVDHMSLAAGTQAVTVHPDGSSIPCSNINIAVNNVTVIIIRIGNPPSLPPCLLASSLHPALCVLSKWGMGMNGCITMNHTHRLSPCSQPLLNVYCLISTTSSFASCIMQGWTALHYATAANRSRAIQMLVSAGADVNAQDGKVR